MWESLIRHEKRVRLDKYPPVVSAASIPAWETSDQAYMCPAEGIKVQIQSGSNFTLFVKQLFSKGVKSSAPTANFIKAVIFFD